MKIAIVNDLKIAQEMLKRALSTNPEYELIWTAWDGLEAVEKAAKDTPDVILMDLIMPNIGGVESTRLIMEKSPCAIILVTATVEGNASLVYEAMGYGALDVTCTPTLTGENGIQGVTALLEKIRQVGRIIGKLDAPANKTTSSFIPTPISKTTQPEIILIGASTGGPQALVQIFSQLPKDFPIPIVVAQHVDSEFASGLAAWLNLSTPLAVKIAIDGTTPQQGNIYIAATKDHLVFSPNGVLKYTTSPSDVVYRPSIDVLFKSFAKYYDHTGVALLLTGMGQDGAEGMLMLRNKGWLTITQDKESSILFGMPQAAIEQNAVCEILPLKDISQVILAHSLDLTPK